MLCLSLVVPSPELVERVRDLYHKRVPDVRFLIPVLNGLSKVRARHCELNFSMGVMLLDCWFCIAFVERSCGCSAQVDQGQPSGSEGGLQQTARSTKWAFPPMFRGHWSHDQTVNELFSQCESGQENFVSPLNPAELLIALHLIDPVQAKVDMKTIIKGEASLPSIIVCGISHDLYSICAPATNLCFSEKSIYTPDVLKLVLQHLMEQQPLPTLFMRTVLQSLVMHPSLINFVMGILQRLIIKQVSWLILPYNLMFIWFWVSVLK